MQDVWVIIFLSKCYASRQPIAKQNEFSCLRISTCLAQVDILQFSTMDMEKRNVPERSKVIKNILFFKINGTTELEKPITRLFG